MITSVEEVRPSCAPRSTFAAITHPHDGAHISSSGTGTPSSQPRIITGRRPLRSLIVAASRLVRAFASP